MASNDFSLFAYENAATPAPTPEKSATALRTISEAAELVDVPQHVLRFWETKFAQITPLKRNGGRRFYRPQDIEILQQIKFLLYHQGYTIKGAQKAIDDFIAARGRNTSLTQDAWMASLPPANVNDNVSHASQTPLAPDAGPGQMAAATADDILADIAQALNEPEETAWSPSQLPSATRNLLTSLRAELTAISELLREQAEKKAA